MADADSELSLTEHVCLALVAEAPTHGWQVGTQLAPDGEIGRIWSRSRPLTYRAIEQLAEKQLVVRTASAAGKRRDRQVVDATDEGHRVCAQWLDTPVEHLREVRIDLLLKLTLRQRAGLDIEPLLLRQQAAFDERIATLTAGSSPADLVGLWRRESARAVRRFLDSALNPPVDDPTRRSMMRISARNQLTATVTAITHGEVMSTVKATLTDGQSITAAITKESVADLDLAHGDDVLVIVKSTEVMIGKP